MESLTVHNVPEMYDEVRMLIRTFGVEEESRNGPVVSIPYPVTVRVRNPDQRVLFDDVRDCNPFFHVMEFVWMLAGSRNSAWLSQFNKQMMEYADEDGLQQGAYGYRWRYHFDRNQILGVVKLLKEDPDTRRAVIGMFDPAYDIPELNGKDIPCNTHIYFRIVEGNLYGDGPCLNMTVCNRSNDAIWGMTGANAVHMTMLQELIAQAVGVRLGEYFVVTNNLHFYKEMPRAEELLHSNRAAQDFYKYKEGVADGITPLVIEGEDWRELPAQSRGFLSNMEEPKNRWLRDVAQPIRLAYTARKNKQTRIAYAHVDNIKAVDWRLACRAWMVRRDAASRN